MPHIFVSKSGQHWFRWWLVAYLAPSHYLKQSWVIVKWTIRNKLQWTFYQNTKLFILENASENIVCEMAVICPGGDELTGCSTRYYSKSSISKKQVRKHETLETQSPRRDTYVSITLCKTSMFCIVSGCSCFCISYSIKTMWIFLRIS